MLSDGAAFQAALSDDPVAVRALFGHDDGDGTIGSGDGVGRQVQTLAADFAGGMLSARLTG